MRWPAGVTSSGVDCGLKPTGERDLGLLACDRPASWAGAFTRNGAAAECVRWSRGLLGRPLRAIVVNSGNANACTGAAGVAAVRKTAIAAARAVGCDVGEVAVASTGPIGIPLPVEKLEVSLPDAHASLTNDVSTFADAIRTTDTVQKTATVEGDGFRVVGVAKGAAMVAPNMATMLAFVVTDAVATSHVLSNVLGAAVSSTFDRICIDACESTNDAVFLVATGRARPVDEGSLLRAVTAVCGRLAEQIVRDAEGGTRLLRISVTGANSDEAAATLGKAIAASALWRAAVHGADPNWGRVVAALGSVDRDLSLDTLEVAIGRQIVFAGGGPSGDRDLAARAMHDGDVLLKVAVGDGRGRADVLSTDLSPDYVRLNAEGAS